MNRVRSESNLLCQKCFMRGICHDTAEGEKYSHQLEGQKPSWQEEDNEEERREGESLIALNNISTVSQ